MTFPRNPMSTPTRRCAACHYAVMDPARPCPECGGKETIPIGQRRIRRSVLWLTLLILGGYILGYGALRASHRLLATDGVYNSDRYGRPFKIHGRPPALAYPFWPLIQLEETARNASRG